MGYDFQEVARECHDENWDYDEKTKCGFTSVRGFGYNTFSLAWMTPSDEKVTDKWKIDVCGCNENYFIDWDYDEGVAMMKAIAKDNGEVTFFRQDIINHGTICVDYNFRDIYIDSASSYNAVYYFIVFPDGTTFIEE